MSTVRMVYFFAMVFSAGWWFGPSSAVAQPPGVRPRQQVPRPSASDPRVQRQQPRPAAPPGNGAPFVLNPQQQAALDQVLAVWEREGAKVKTMKAAFTRFEHDNVFGKRTMSEGVVQYAAPDKGLYRIDKSETGQTEHWVCDGESIFEFNAAKKQLIERPIPPEMRGRAISDGPLPFLFGSTAEKLKQRYFMRITTTAQEHAKGEIWIEAYPRFQRDAANFARAEIVLLARDLSSVRALKIVLPGGKKHTVHAFGKATINSPWQVLAPDFAKPKPPFGWEKVVQRTPAPGPTAAVPSPATGAQRFPAR